MKIPNELMINDGVGARYEVFAKRFQIGNCMGIKGHDGLG
jgi:hypothetical protein